MFQKEAARKRKRATLALTLPDRLFEGGGAASSSPSNMIWYHTKFPKKMVNSYVPIALLACSMLLTLAAAHGTCGMDDVAEALQLKHSNVRMRRDTRVMDQRYKLPSQSLPSLGPACSYASTVFGYGLILAFSLRFFFKSSKLCPAVHRLTIFQATHSASFRALLLPT